MTQNPNKPHQGSPVPRVPRENEVLALPSCDGWFCIAIVMRPDGLFDACMDRLWHDSEDDVYFWDREDAISPSLYGSVEIAEREVRSLPDYLGKLK